MIRVVLPAHLRTLARVEGEVKLDVQGQVTQRSVLDALEESYPMLCGTLRDHVTQKRRPFVRFFACEEDLSHEPPDAPLPEAVAKGEEPFLVVGAIAGGAAPISKSRVWVGRIVSGLAVAFLLLDGVMKVLRAQVSVDGTVQLGYPGSLVVGLGVLLLICTLLYLIPQTSVLGAILLTGYLDGAVATQLRAGNPLFSHVFFPVYVGGDDLGRTFFA
jgi:molybdopterin synthase sulfur carrier subunit